MSTIDTGCLVVAVIGARLEDPGCPKDRRYERQSKPQFTPGRLLAVECRNTFGVDDATASYGEQETILRVR